jgi:hypothetical protein
MQMSDTDLIAKAKDFYENLTADFPGYVNKYMAQDVVWINPMPPAIPFGGTYHGHAGLFEYFGEIVAVLEMHDLDFDYTQSGNTVFAVGTERGTKVIPTGKTYDMDCVHVVKFNDDGMIIEVREYNDITNMYAAFQA